jgi:hypothetical protein
VGILRRHIEVSNASSPEITGFPKTLAGFSCAD